MARKIQGTYTEVLTDPTLGVGYDAPIGTVIRFGSVLYEKTAAADTDWTTPPGGGGGGPPTGAAGGDLATTYPNPEVAAIHETSGPTKLTIGAIVDTQFLKRVGTTIVSAVPPGGTPSGAAGGDLAATYPNPEVAAIHETAGPTKLTIGAVADLQFLKRVGTTLVGVPAPASDGKALVSGADTTTGFLGAKLVAGTNVTFTTLNPGANEQISIATSGGGGGGSGGGASVGWVGSVESFFQGKTGIPSGRIGYSDPEDFATLQKWATVSGVSIDTTRDNGVLSVPAGSSIAKTGPVIPVAPTRYGIYARVTLAATTNAGSDQTWWGGLSSDSTQAVQVGLFGPGVGGSGNTWQARLAGVTTTVLDSGVATTTAATDVYFWVDGTSAFLQVNGSVPVSTPIANDDHSKVLREFIQASAGGAAFTINRFLVVYEGTAMAIPDPTSGGLVSIYSVDYTAQASQTFASGPVTIDGITAHVENAAIATTFDILNGTGMRIVPAGNALGGAPPPNRANAPIITYRFEDIDTRVRDRNYSEIRVWALLTLVAPNNLNALGVAVENYQSSFVAADSLYLGAYFSYSGGNSWNAYIAQGASVNSYALSSNAYNSNDVVCLVRKNPFLMDVYTGASVAGAFPTFDSLTLLGMIGAVASSPNSLEGKFSNNLGVHFVAASNTDAVGGSSMTVKKMKIEAVLY